MHRITLLWQVAHPDKTQGLVKSEQAFTLVKRAFDVLKEHSSRTQFDLLRRSATMGQNTAAGASAQQSLLRCHCRTVYRDACKRVVVAIRQ